MTKLITLNMDDVICGTWYHIYLEGITLEELVLMQSGTEEEYMEALLAKGAEITPMEALLPKGQR